MATLVTTATQTPCLGNCLSRHADRVPELADIVHVLNARRADTTSLAPLIELYDTVYPLLEKAMWETTDDEVFDVLLDTYQALFREQETLIEQEATRSGRGDERYAFILAIPVADRPRHLQACLENIYQVLERFGYGGRHDGYYEKVRIIVAEDSREAHNVRQHRDLVEAYRRKGLDVSHFGLEEQYALLQQLPAEQRDLLGNILTRQPGDRFYRKGQAANRNLSYLKFLQLTADPQRTLYYLVDSDQNFCVNRRGRQGERAVHALNYFYIIDRIFRSTDTAVLTGKMVGDPPVSPAVMAANFLDDVLAFFRQLAVRRPDAACSFHGHTSVPVGDAAYHDMANLFGFTSAQDSYVYPCPLEGPHDHRACLRRFAHRLNAFFFGEHLTRRTQFVHGKGFEALSPARTVYPGNYIVNYEGLRYIIPFGHLRLRMSGPTAGRLIAAEIGPRFAAVNMPHLHQRTTTAEAGDDFRPGVEAESDAEDGAIDISDEFERQFFGDLMLFATEALVKQADVRQAFTRDMVLPILEAKEQELLALYRQKQEIITRRLRDLSTLFTDTGNWWNREQGLELEKRAVQTFIDNISRNFGPAASAWQQIQSPEHRAVRKTQIVDALCNYRRERDAWDTLFG